MELVPDDITEQKEDSRLESKPSVTSIEDARKFAEEIHNRLTANDPVISEDDMALVNKTRRVASDLKVELKTVIGFTSDYLVEKYGIKDQAQFDRIIGSL